MLPFLAAGFFGWGFLLFWPLVFFGLLSEDRFALVFCFAGLATFAGDDVTAGGVVTAGASAGGFATGVAFGFFPGLEVLALGLLLDLALEVLEALCAYIRKNLLKISLP